MARAAVAMNPKAWMKSANLYSLCSFPSTTVQPARLERASASSGPENLRMFLLSFFYRTSSPRLRRPCDEQTDHVEFADPRRLLRRCRRLGLGLAPIRHGR